MKSKQYTPEEYSILVRQEIIENESIFVARVLEFPDLVDYADSYNEAYLLICESIKFAQEIAIEQNQKTPAPKAINATSYSGRITLRIPKSLHEELSIESENENVSLNHWISSILSNRHKNYPQNKDSALQNLADSFQKLSQDYFKQGITKNEIKMTTEFSEVYPRLTDHPRIFSTNLN